MHRRMRTLGGLALAATLGACAQQAGRVEPAAPREAPEPRAHYTTEVPQGEPPGDDPVSRAVAELAVDADLQYDPRLTAVARRLLPPGPLQSPEVRVVDALMREHGLVEPVPLLNAAAGTASGVANMLVDDARKALPDRAPTHWGLAVRNGPKGAAAILLLSSRHVQLKPVPRRVAPATQLHLQGTLATGYRQPGWVVTPPRGDVRRLPPASEGRDFDLQLALESRGVHRVELIAEGAGGVTVVANFPVWVGVEPPAVKVENRKTTAGAPADAAEVEARLRELIARERRRAGRPPLKRAPALDAVALAHTRDMARHHFVAHESPRTGSPADRVRDAGLSAWLVRENLGRGYSADEIHEGLMQSPGHRDNVLSRDAESLGIAVVETPEGTRSAFLATELFVSLSRPVDLAEAQRRVVEHIREARSAAGLKPAQTHPGLTRAARAAAARFFREPVDKERLLGDAMQKAPMPKGTEQLGASMAVLHGLGQIEGSDLGLQPEAKFLGVGVAQGQRGDGPPHALAVVVLLGL